MAREIRVEILGDARDFSRATRTASGDAARLEGTFRRVGDGASRMSRAIGIAAVGGIAIGAHAVRGFLEAAEESQQVTRQTAAVIRSMGGVANVSAQQVSRLSTRLSLMSGIDDELIQSGQNVLLTFGQVRNEIGEGNNVFDRATEAALNMSVALGTDMNSAAMMVGKALNDPVRGLTALRRSGIQFTREQEDMIRWLTATGDALGAQRIMLAELDRQFGGSAEAQSTASGRLAVAWGNIQEQIGEALLPAFESVATWLADSLPGFMETAGEVIDTAKTKWEEFTTAVFGEEDWKSFWQDVENGWDEAGDKWEEFTKNSEQNWKDFTAIVFDRDGWDEWWAETKDGWDKVYAGFFDFVHGMVDLAILLRNNLFPNPVNPLSGGLEFPGDALPGPLDINTGTKPPTTINPNLKPGGMPRGFQQFDSGGVVRGPLGSPQLVIAHGGETFLPTHKSGMAGATNNYFYGEPDTFILKVLDASNGRTAREVRRDLNWSVG